jgi:hypothetical protein
MQCHSFLGAKMRKEIYEMYRFRYMDKKNQSTKLVIELFNHRIKQLKDAASQIGITTGSSW